MASDTTYTHGAQLLLPRNLAALAKCTAKGDGLRYGATTGVQLEATRTGYIATVTDGRQLVTVTGEHPAKLDEYPAAPALMSAPNSGACNVVPGKDWLTAFRALPKRTHKTILDNLAVVMGLEVTTLVSTDLSSVNAMTPENLTRMVMDANGKTGTPANRFPDWRRAMPTGKPKFSLRVDPSIMATVLNTVSAFSDGDAHAVTLDFWTADKPIRITTANVEHSQKATGLVIADDRAAFGGRGAPLGGHGKL